MLGKITPLGVVVAELVTDDGVRNASLIKTGNYVRSNKPGPAGD
jgi:hypothetical protein